MIFGKKEDEVSNLIEEHSKYVEKCLKYLSDGVNAYLDNNYCTCDEHREKILKYEHKADIVREKVQLKLYEGAFMPLYRDDIYMFIDKFDNIADETKHIIDGFSLEHPQIPKYLIDDFKLLLKNTLSPYKDLKTAVIVFKTDREKTLAATAKIEKKETKVDIMEHELRKRIFDDNNLSLAEKMQLKFFGKELARISDIIEDCSDLLEAMVVKRQI